MNSSHGATASGIQGIGLDIAIEAQGNAYTDQHGFTRMK